MPSCVSPMTLCYRRFAESYCPNVHTAADKHPDMVQKLVQKIYDDHTDSPLFPVTLPPKE